ncbi:hypothetical protein E4U42_004263 [Claviceps africana]|uniref:Uncharacterized protein n=1 Tax=Claviceps africana TaxID=83212 RepID=A0A8K0NKY1_9HYPO|nr:hypothetical protein E4U42_004263 [Claviceps africana]
MSSLSNGLDAAGQPPPSTSRRTSGLRTSGQPCSRHQNRWSLPDVAPPSKLNRRPYLHRRQSSQHEDREKAPLSSALPAARVRLSLDNPVSTGKASLMSPTGSRHESPQATSQQALGEQGHEESKLEGEARLLLKPEQGQQLEQASLRTDGLKQSLMELNSFSTTMTKRLDDTYYSVLERMSTLANTVTALRELARASRDICETFDRDARDLESDIIRQLSTAGQFEDKQRRIAALQKRIYESRDKIAALASRVDAVQRSVERWEQADKRWQERTRKRLKIIWSATMVLVLLVIAFVVGMNYARGSAGHDEADRFPDWMASMSPNIPPWLSARRNESAGGESARTLLWKKTRMRDAEQLRAFDEL